MNFCEASMEHGCCLLFSNLPTSVVDKLQNEKSGKQVANEEMNIQILQLVTQRIPSLFFPNSLYQFVNVDPGGHTSCSRGSEFTNPPIYKFFKHIFSFPFSKNSRSQQAEIIQLFSFIKFQSTILNFRIEISQFMFATKSIAKKPIIYIKSIAF